MSTYIFTHWITSAIKICTFHQYVLFNFFFKGFDNSFQVCLYQKYRSRFGVTGKFKYECMYAYIHKRICNTIYACMDEKKFRGWGGGGVWGGNFACLWYPTDIFYVNWKIQICQGFFYPLLYPRIIYITM